MNQKENISSRFILTKIFVALWLISGFYLFFQNSNNTSEIIDYFQLFSIPLLLLFFTATRKEVQFDSKKFYLSNWRGEEIEVIPLEKISSMLYAGIEGNHGMMFNIFQAYRFFYFSKDGTKKEFWLYPRFKVSIPQLQKKLKTANPDVIILNDSFFIAHLLFRNEDWFR